MTHKDRYQLSEHSAAALSEALSGASVAVRDLVAAELQAAYLMGRIDAVTEANAKLDERLTKLIKNVEAAAMAEDVNELILKKANRSS